MNFIDDETLARVKKQLEKIEFYSSKEYKDKVKFEQETNNSEYWREYNNAGDRTPMDYSDLSEWEKDDTE